MEDIQSEGDIGENMQKKTKLETRADNSGQKKSKKASPNAARYQPQPLEYWFLTHLNIGTYNSLLRNSIYVQSSGYFHGSLCTLLSKNGNRVNLISKLYKALIKAGKHKYAKISNLKKNSKSHKKFKKYKFGSLVLQNGRDQ